MPIINKITEVYSFLINRHSHILEPPQMHLGGFFKHTLQCSVLAEFKNIYILYLHSYMF